MQKYVYMVEKRFSDIMGKGGENLYDNGTAQGLVFCAVSNFIEKRAERMYNGSRRERILDENEKG